jgi:hypothetical protein
VREPQIITIYANDSNNKFYVYKSGLKMVAQIFTVFYFLSASGSVNVHFCRYSRQKVGSLVFQHSNFDIRSCSDTWPEQIILPIWNQFQDLQIIWCFHSLFGLLASLFSSWSTYVYRFKNRVFLKFLSVMSTIQLIIYICIQFCSTQYRTHSYTP